MDSRLSIAKIQFEKGKMDDAIESCMQMIQIDRNWNNRAAYNLLIEIFNKLGSSNEIVIKARKRLSKILF